MTREDALNKTIGILTYHQVNFCKSKEAVANMNEIIEALEKIEQEHCGDCISRQAVLDINEHHHGQMPNHVNHEIWKEIKVLPSVTPQPKVGHWIYHKPFDLGHKNCNECIECSQCHIWLDYDCYAKTPYCPFCGFKMQEVQNED